MARQITFGSADASAGALEHRVAVLERRVVALAEALQVMAMVLENTAHAPSDEARALALRRARELLLPQPPGSP